ncbi:uncharacterized protein TNCV_1188751 [Trichonephila clavipes]|nr:uncharacterized protein TNCV_1188751 [Trichonephila clavipes]
MGRLSGNRLWDYNRKNLENKSKQGVIMEESSKQGTEPREAVLPDMMMMSTAWPHDKACFTWPLRSPDLTPCDLYLWGFIKYCVYVRPLPADLPDIRHRIEAAVARITSDTLNKDWDELAYRLDVYRVTNGTHVEHLYACR